MTRERSRTIKCFAGILLIILCLCCPALCLDNGLALTPPMGFNTWNAYHDDIDEQLIFSAADILVKSGLAAAGYRYLNIDGAYKVTLLRSTILVMSTTLSYLCLGMYGSPQLLNEPSGFLKSARCLFRQMDGLLYGEMLPTPFRRIAPASPEASRLLQTMCMPKVIFVR